MMHKAACKAPRPRELQGASIAMETAQMWRLAWYKSLDAHTRARRLSLLVRAVDPPTGLIIGCVMERHFLCWQ